MTGPAQIFVFANRLPRVIRWTGWGVRASVAALRRLTALEERLKELNKALCDPSKDRESAASAPSRH